MSRVRHTYGHELAPEDWEELPSEYAIRSADGAYFCGVDSDSIGWSARRWAWRSFSPATASLMADKHGGRVVRIRAWSRRK